MKARIARDQPIEEKRVNALRLRVGSNARIKICRTALDQKDYSARIAPRRVAARER
jgi:hypothetical protein